jgi:hypothetical protein
MGTIYFDSRLRDEDRRQRLYAGDLFVFSPGQNSAELCALARKLSEEAFAPHHPQVAQNSMPAEEYASILADLKPRFIHHPRAKESIRGLLAEVGCDLEKTFFDVPRLRTMAHGEYMRAGLALQFHPHRDTWFSAPFAQLNWWLPVYEIASENSMAIHPDYFNCPVRNSSREYDYDDWNRTGRKQAAQQITQETRKQPKADEELELELDVRIVTPVGGVFVFSASQMHSTVPNTTERTRFSIDFRTVHLDDLANGKGASNVDSECTGTTLRDFLHADNLSPLPEYIVAKYERGHRAGGSDASVIRSLASGW